jgi:hypothetical protein
MLKVWQDKRHWLVHVAPVFKKLFSCFDDGFNCNTTAEHLHFERKFVSTDNARAARRSMPEAAANIMASNETRIAAARQTALAGGDPLSRRSVAAQFRLHQKLAAAADRQAAAAAAAAAAPSDGSLTIRLRKAEKRLADLQKAQAVKDGAAAEEPLGDWRAPRAKPAVPVGARDAPAFLDAPGTAPTAEADEGGAAAEEADVADDDGGAAAGDGGAAAGEGGAAGGAAAGGSGAPPAAQTEKQRQLAAARNGLETHAKKLARLEEELESSKVLVAASHTRVALMDAAVEAELLGDALSSLPAARDEAVPPGTHLHPGKCTMRGCSEPTAPGCAHGACGFFMHCRGKQQKVRSAAQQQGKPLPPLCALAVHQPPGAS